MKKLGFALGAGGDFLKNPAFFLKQK